MKNQELCNFFRTRAKSVNLSASYKALNGKYVDSLLPAEPIAVQPRLRVSQETKLDRDLVRHGGIRTFEWVLTGQSVADMAFLRESQEMLHDLYPSGYQSVINAAGTFATPQALRGFVEALDDDDDLGMLGRNLLYILDPFPTELSFHRDVVALFAEWPRRPAMVLTADGTPPNFLSRVLDWGYAGIVLQAAKDFERAVVDRCYLTARKDREPIGKYTFDGGALPISQGREAILNELAAQSVLGNKSIACEPVAAILELLSDSHPGRVNA
ncbi:hypothetical protein [Ruficoccus sp. ZRK36]|uniref:hypothetical protein n=1 Tax=Ruficoccus sp. ZRK36 TaxID=2866311 RepID=UPI001C7385BC|nr:hypothetical protein [Ruficoccus sp. ZRK36]QYY37216.1 hypothetical protein K0V07_06960 [Ruficoccus sp. ZRK36]